jgi:hypothetical protein
MIGSIGSHTDTPWLKALTCWMGDVRPASGGAEQAQKHREKLMKPLTPPDADRPRRPLEAL